MLQEHSSKMLPDSPLDLVNHVGDWSNRWIFCIYVSYFTFPNRHSSAKCLKPVIRMYCIYVESPLPQTRTSPTSLSGLTTSRYSTVDTLRKHIIIGLLWLKTYLGWLIHIISYVEMCGWGRFSILRWDDHWWWKGWFGPEEIWGFGVGWFWVVAMVGVRYCTYMYMYCTLSVHIRMTRASIIPAQHDNSL